MTTERAFLQTIHAEPAEATHKLVFTDWLEERDDLRAGLVRRIMRFQELTGDAATCYERGAILPLLDGRFADWLLPLTAWGDVFIAERGLLRLKLVPTEEVRPAWQPDPVWDWVTELVVASNLDSAGDLGCAAHLAERLHRPDLGVCVAAWVPAIPELRWVTSLDYELDDLLWRGGMPNLREVRRRRLGREALQRGIASKPETQLRVLEFGISRETPRPEFEWLAGSALCDGLEEFTFLGAEPLGAADLATLASAEWFPRLRRLSLPLASMSHDDHWPLAAAGPLSNLEVLRLTGAGVNHVRLQSLVDGPTRRSLRSLDFDHSDLGASDVRALVECEHLRDLRELSLGLTDEGDAVLRLLASAPWPRLASLGIDLGDASTDGLRYLAEGTVLPHLVHLSLGFTWLGRPDLSVLTDSPAVAGLLGLDLRGRLLDDETAAALIRSPHLSRRCTVKGWANALSPSTRAALRQRFLKVELSP
jgi:uncharacterized protein (TIGR02996 family)